MRNQIEIILWSGLREIIRMQFNYRALNAYKALNNCASNGFQKMLLTMLMVTVHQHNQNHCHFALRGKIFSNSHSRSIQFEPRRDSVNIFMIITRPPASARRGSISTCKSLVYQPKTKREIFFSPPLQLLQINKILSPSGHLIIGEKQKHKR